MSGEVVAPTCPICMQDAATVGVLCESCSDELCGTILITPEQINAPTVGGPSAALIDQWGRPNLIGEEATIGRDSENPGLAILHGSVSRQHATVRFERDDWTLREMGSMNGTIVNGRLVKGTVKLADRDQIRFGPFRFYFVADATKLPASRTRPATRTVQTRPYERAIFGWPEELEGQKEW